MLCSWAHCSRCISSIRLSRCFFSSRPALILLDLLVSITLLAATYAVHRSTRVLLVAGVFACPAIAGRWASYAVHSDWLFILSHCFGFFFLAFTGGAILLNILRPPRDWRHR